MMGTRLRVSIDVDGHTESVGIDLPYHLAKLVAPVRATDDPVMAIANGEDYCTTLTDSCQYQVRVDAVERLSKDLARLLMQLVRNRDTMNGYPVKVESMDSVEMPSMSDQLGQAYRRGYDDGQRAEQERNTYRPYSGDWAGTREGL